MEENYTVLIIGGGDAVYDSDTYFIAVFNYTLRAGRIKSVVQDFLYLSLEHDNLPSYNGGDISG